MLYVCSIKIQVSETQLFKPSCSENPDVLLAAGMDKGSEAWGLGLKGFVDLVFSCRPLGIWAGASNSEFRVGVKGLRAQGS